MSALALSHVNLSNHHGQPLVIKPTSLAVQCNDTGAKYNTLEVPTAIVETENLKDALPSCLSRVHNLDSGALPANPGITYTRSSAGQLAMSWVSTNPALGSMLRTHPNPQRRHGARWSSVSGTPCSWEK